MRTRCLPLLLLLSLLVSCGNDAGPAGPGDTPPPEVLPPNPDGMLLEGAPGDDARGATVFLSPSPVAPADIQGHLLTTRLAAAIAPGATVAAVNAALAAEDAAIVSMNADDPFVLLAIDAVADRAEGEARAADLVATGAFSYARPGYMSTPLIPSAAAGDRDYPDDGALAGAPHLIPARMPAAWNLRRAASSRGTLMAPGWYADVPGYSEVPQLEFVEDAGEALFPDDPFYRAGNLGFYYLGIAAANWDYDPLTSPHTGADPVAEERLDVVAVDTYGLDDCEAFGPIVLNLPVGEPVVLLSTSTYDDPEGDFFRYVDRAWAALRWRRLVYSLTGNPGFLHVVSAGGTGESDAVINDAALNSCYGFATALSLPGLASLDATEEEAAAFQAAYDADVAAQPLIAQPLTNVLLVGSSNAIGEESSFSTPGSEVRMVGEGVIGPCLVGPDCNGVSVTMDGTAGAAAQVAGLACYLWHLDPLRSMPDLLLRLQHAYSASGTPGILDASIAALSLDTAVNDLMRKTLLDVSGPQAVPDGVFDEDDIEEFLQAFEAFAGASQPDYSVFDLNGDGWTAGPGGARMDLDANDLPGFSVVEQVIEGETVSFDETDVTDEEVLCYYAYSPLYAGAEGTRRDLLGGHCGGSAGTLPGSRARSEFDLDVETDGGSYDSADGADLALIPDFGDYATSFDSSLTIGAVSASAITYTTAALHRESGGTVTLAFDAESEARAQWAVEGDYAGAGADGRVDVGLELVGEYSVAITGRLIVDAPGEDADAWTSVHVGPDSTLYGWWQPGGATWAIGGSEVGQGIYDIEFDPVAMPAGIHRIWVNVYVNATAGDSSYDVGGGSNTGTATIENLLITLVPTGEGRNDARVISRRRSQER